MCGGKSAAFERAKPILEKLSSSLCYIGAAGQAAQVKALVNMVMNINTAGLAEGLGLGAALGLDLTMLREVFSQTGARSGVLQTDGEDMQNREHSCFFSAAHAAKDSGIALKLVYPGRYEGLSIALYLALGWAGLAALGQLIENVPWPGLALMGSGGLLFTLGVYFHARTRFRYHNLIWHGFVLAGAASHVCMMLFYIRPAG